MVVRADGSTLGTIGGGKVEDAIRRDAVEALSHGTGGLRTYPLQEPDRGDPGVCGGTMTVYLEAYMSPHTVFVVGAGHVGKAVVDLAHWLGYRTVVVDERSEMVTVEAMANADVRFAGTVADALDVVPVTEDTAIVVISPRTAVAGLLRLAQLDDKIRLGVFYRDEHLPAYEAVRAVPAKTADEKIAMLSDPDKRRELNELAQGPSPLRGIAKWEVLRVGEIFSEEFAHSRCEDTEFFARAKALEAGFALAPASVVHRDFGDDRTAFLGLLAYSWQMGKYNMILLRKHAPAAEVRARRRKALRKVLCEVPKMILRARSRGDAVRYLVGVAKEAGMLAGAVASRPDDSGKRPPAGLPGAGEAATRR
jgi:hypothetical protein